MQTETTISKNETPVVQVRRAYRPSDTPWTAKRGGTERLVWYTVFNCFGDEVASMGSVLEDEEDALIAQLYLMLTAVNQSETIEIDGRQVRIEWR